MSEKSEDKDIKDELYKMANARLGVVKTIIKRHWNHIPMDKVRRYLEVSTALSTKEKGFIELGLNMFPSIVSLIDVDMLIQSEPIIRNNALATPLRLFNLEVITDFDQFKEKVTEMMKSFSSDLVEMYRLVCVLLTISHVQFPQKGGFDWSQQFQTIDVVVACFLFSCQFHSCYRNYLHSCCCTQRGYC